MVSKPILILGCQRSGTTLLASLLGRHQEINMLFESTTKDVFSLIGKKYQGNKLLTWRQIRLNQRASRFGHFVNRMVNFDFTKDAKPHKYRIYPTSRLSIEDYIQKGAIIITIDRPKEEVVSSIMKRTKMTEAQASYEYDESKKILEAMKGKGVDVSFYELVNFPEKTLKMICGYLDLEFEERMLEGSKFNPVYPSDSIDKSRASK